jgi:co-chaperonin GroES (HSP10)
MIRVLGDRVLVALPPEPDEIVSASGLILKRDPDIFRTPTQGIVMALGDKIGSVDLDDVVALVAECDGTYEVLDQIRALFPAAFDVAVGDCVIFPRGAGDEITDAGIDYVILREHEILGIVEPLKGEAA